MDAPPSPAPRAAYIHVPFCRWRCGYCNFTVLAGRDDLTGTYLDALERELSALGRPYEVDTLYFGGGTPTHLPPHEMDRLFQIVYHWHPPASAAEITVEANPRDLTDARAAVLRRWSVNRCSLGGQSFQTRKLRALERDHTREDVFKSAEQVRHLGAALAIDLIFAAPEETLEEWRADLQDLLALAPDHVSTYGLTYEKGTTFWSRRRNGTLIEADDEIQIAMFTEAIAMLEHTGYEHYEVSNFALPASRSRHNQVYWSGDPYFAAGPGAARFLNGVRETNHRSATTWVRRVLSGDSPVAERDELAADDRARELLILALRRRDGVDRADFHRRTGFDLDRLAGERLQEFVRAGLLEDNGPCVRLTRKGLLISDALWPELV